ncbi:hypothetical protein BU24DRAFT_462708 [Aaosphaeria arxii CBS 175.79]|uniref:SPT23/MGA2-like DNA-binding domain-containing protein n=1 Tax=Aaosphaeria arxii CBS 175.79 TaxID=1450172 RepID=A0A6A5XTA7_9PLEO|nr:uncharacterized protein BU24DRAFT_462708 [Aaosphaeria arxii CBS 175.79]KAF2016565.1 hypothetical protein BU24DRAFT_462708 [Aaosphaeria arxii CBS 175.79]
MDDNFFFDDTNSLLKQTKTVNPADVFTNPYASNSFLPSQFCAFEDTQNPPHLSSFDSAVDLTTMRLADNDSWNQSATDEAHDNAFNSLIDMGDLAEGSNSQPSSTPSPANDPIFSQGNSPGDFLRERSQPTSREASTDVIPKVDESSILERLDNFFAMNGPAAHPGAMFIPKSPAPAIETASVHLFPDKTKTRAETQIKVVLVLDPLEDRFENIRFPRKTLAKPKLLASPEERTEIEARHEAVYMDMLLVCSTAIEKDDRREQALRRARGEEPVPRRQEGQSISEIEKDDPAHPQNGGEVLICDGCRERERKRYDRKKKKADDESEWFSYEGDRVIMINEKEYKKLKEVDASTVDDPSKYSPRAKQVDFAMRIACYCRHQEEKSPVGYRVIFTFKDAAGSLIAQHVSEIFQITDDHKNKETPVPEAPARPLHAPQPQQHFAQTQAAYPAPIIVPQYPYDPQQFAHMPQSGGGMGAFTHSQPPTPPLLSSYTSPMAISPLDTHFPQMVAPTGPIHSRQTPSFSASTTSVTAPQFPRPQPHARYDVPFTSPTNQYPSEAPYLMSRPTSMENFNFGNQYSNAFAYQQNGFSSAPGSVAGTPHNLSRPASPNWEQQGQRKKFII